MNRCLIFAALCLLVAHCVAEPDLSNPDVPNDEVPSPVIARNLFKKFCFDASVYLRQSLSARSRGLLPNFMLYVLDNGSERTQGARAHLEGLLSNPGAELRQLDAYMAQQQKQLFQRLSERPFQPTAIYDRAQEQVRSFLRDPLAHLKRVDTFFSDQQRALAQRLQKHPFEPVNFLGEAMNRLRSVAGRIVAAPSALFNETCVSFGQYRAEIEKRFQVAREQLKAQDPRVDKLELGDAYCPVIQRVDEVLEVCVEKDAKKESTEQQ